MTEGSDATAAGEAEIPEGAWTVAELNEEIRAALSDVAYRFPTHVVGEIAEVEAYDFGTFFDLRDLDAEPSLSCLAWDSVVGELEYDLEEGTKAVVEADVDFYPDHGECRLMVSDYFPLGESSRQQEFEALRAQLDEEGLFDEKRKRPIPPHPACVGLVTSLSGSAREDAWSAISERSPRTDVKLRGASVQGENAVPSLIEGVNELDADGDVETIILTRGGGSDSDLWCFNAEPLVRTIAACTTPIVVAIGHEDDETLVEFVADERAMTPTEAGVLATTDVGAVFETLHGVERRVETAYRAIVDERLDEFARRVDTAHERLQQRVERRESLQQRARDLEQRIGTAYGTLRATRLDDLEARIDQGLQDVELAAETEAASARAARSRVADLEARVDGAYESFVTRELEAVDRRIEDAYRDLEATERVAAGTSRARRLRIVVAVMLAILLLETGVLIVLFLL